jgi:hypothetical protein
VLVAVLLLGFLMELWCIITASNRTMANRPRSEMGVEISIFENIFFLFTFFDCTIFLLH